MTAKVSSDWIKLKNVHLVVQIVKISTNARLVPTTVPLIKSVPTVTDPMNVFAMTDFKNQMENVSVRQTNIKMHDDNFEKNEYLKVLEKID